jgi:hypothetical protein
VVDAAVRWYARQLKVSPAVSAVEKFLVPAGNILHSAMHAGFEAKVEAHEVAAALQNASQPSPHGPPALSLGSLSPPVMPA